MSKELSIKLLLDDKEALSKLNKALKTIDDDSKRSVDSMNLSWAGFASQLFIIEKALQPVIGFMTDAVKASIAQEDAVRRLNTAMELQGTFTEDLSAKYQAMADSLQKNTRFADDAILEVMQTLVTIGNVAPESMERVTQATLDLATATGKDLTSAASLMAKAATGNVESLGRLGIKIDESTLKSMKFEEILKLIEQRMGGSAQKDVESFGGAVAQLNNAWDEVLEGFGDLVTKTPEFKGAVKLLTDQLVELKKALASVEVQNAARNAMLELQKVSVITAAGVTGLMIALEKANERIQAIKSGTAKIDPLRGIVGGVDTTKSDELKATYDELIRKAVELDEKQREIRENQGARLAEERGILLDENAQKAVEAFEQAERDKALQIEKDRIILESFLGSEQIKIDTVLRNTTVATQLREQETLKALDLKQRELQAKGKLSDLELKQLQAIEEAKSKIASEAAKARFETQKQAALATADLLDAVSVASGKGILKGVAIVLRAVVVAVEVMQSSVNPFLKLLKVAVTVVQTVNALNQLQAAERALEASRGESVQAVTNVQGLAGGTPEVSQAGVFQVGERGPERVILPRGSAVLPNQGSSGNVYHIQVVINNPVFTPDNLADEVVRTIGPRLSQFIDVERERL